MTFKQDHQWRISSASQQPNARVFARPLGLTETGFYWDALMSGTADTITQYTIDARLSSSSSGSTYSRDHFIEAWLALKQQFPLLGARVEEDSSGDQPQFLVDEQRLNHVEDDLVFRDIVSQSEVDSVVEDNLNGTRQLSNKLLAKCVVLRSPDKGTFHLVFVIAHLITDGMANGTVGRTFFNTLAESRQSNGARPDLEARLNMVPSQESLMPFLGMSIPRQRWRRAIAFALWHVVQSKMTGGHTIPNKITPETFHTPAKSKMIVTSLPEDVSATIVKTCRANNITFGHAFPIIAQLAMSRILHRRYARGEISQEDWEYRLRQPTHTGGPLNLRPFLDKNWLTAGGQQEVNICISFFFLTMPFMPGAASAQLDSTGAPPLSATLSRQRFLWRAAQIKKQMSNFVKNPLFCEMTLARGPSRVARVRDMVLQWRAIQEGRAAPSQQGESTGTAGAFGAVMQCGGSSMGVVDHLLPLTYPPPPVEAKPISPVKAANLEEGSMAPIKTSASLPTRNSKEPAIKLLSNRTYLRCRPTELYLGCATTRGKMVMHVYYDGNAFEDAVVEEWLNEVRDAAAYYLASHPNSTSAKL